MIMLNERQRNRKSDDPDGNEPNVIFRPEGRLATSTGRALHVHMEWVCPSTWFSVSLIPCGNGCYQQLLVNPWRQGRPYFLERRFSGDPSLKAIWPIGRLERSRWRGGRFACAIRVDPGAKVRSSLGS